jgi:hypothetical protein
VTPVKKRIIYILCGIPVAAFITFCLCVFLSMLMVHAIIIENGHKYQPQIITSYDQKYAIETERSEDESGVYASFQVVLTESEEILFDCSERYRTFDLKGIYWDVETYDIIVDSGDVGTIVYNYSGGSWKKSNLYPYIK